MDQNLADALELPELLVRLRALPENKHMYFAYAPDESVLLLDPRKELTKAKLVAALRAAQVEPGPLTETVWCGDVRWAADHPAFHVDPERSVGQPLKVRDMRLGLIGLSRELKGCIALRDPEIVRPSDKIMSRTELKVEGGKAGWKAKMGKGSPYFKLLAELESLGSAGSNEARREILIGLMVRVGKWFGSHGEDIGDGGDKALRAAALTELRDQLVHELARTLDEGRLEPTAEERAMARAALEDQARRALDPMDLDALSDVARSVERWTDLGVRPDEGLSIQISSGLCRALRDEPTRATPRSVKAVARFVRRVRLDMLDAPDGETRLALIGAQLEALEAAEVAINLVMVSVGEGPEWEETQRVAARELVKLQRDLEAIRQEQALQTSIHEDPTRFEFTGGETSTGASGSYFVRDGQRAKVAVFKPTSQEVSEDPDGWPSGYGARGEVLGYRVGELLGQRLGLDLGVPRTQVGSLESERFGQYRPPMDLDPELTGARQQLGVMQDFVRVSEGNIGEFFVYRDEELGVEVPQDKDNAEQMRLVGEALQGHPEIHWDTLDEPQQIELFNRICSPDNELVRWPESVNLDELGVGLDRIAILDLFTLQTDRNPGNVLIDVRDGHTRAVPIDQALSMPGLRAGKNAFGREGYVDRKNPFTAWIQAPGHDRPLDPDLVAGILGLDIDAQIEDLQLESEQLDESTGGRMPALGSENLQVQRLTMRSVKYVLSARPALTRRQLANVLLDFDRIPWSEQQRPSSVSPVGEALGRLLAIKQARVEAELDEGLQGGPRRRLIRERLEEDLLSINDFEEEWRTGLRPSLDRWLAALPNPME